MRNCFRAFVGVSCQVPLNESGNLPSAGRADEEASDPSPRSEPETGRSGACAIETHTMPVQVELPAVTHVRDLPQKSRDLCSWDKAYD